MIGFLYLPDFPAWAASRADQSFSLTAVYQRDRIIARSPDLAWAGMTIGMSVAQAQAQFPVARFVAYDPVQTTQLWHEVIREVYALTPFMYPLSQGQLAFRYLTTEECEALAKRFEAHIGRAETLVAARFAALHSHAGELTDIEAGTDADFVAGCDVALLRPWLPNDGIVVRLMQGGHQNIRTILGYTQDQWLDAYGTDGQKVHEILNPASFERELHNYVPPVAIRRSIQAENLTEKALMPFLASVARHILQDIRDVQTPRLVLEVTPVHSPTVLRYSRSLQNLGKTEADVLQLLLSMLTGPKRKKLNIGQLAYTLHGFAPAPFVRVDQRENQLSLFAAPSSASSRAAGYRVAS